MTKWWHIFWMHWITTAPSRTLERVVSSERERTGGGRDGERRQQLLSGFFPTWSRNAVKLYWRPNVCSLKSSSQHFWGRVTEGGGEMQPVETRCLGIWLQRKKNTSCVPGSEWRREGVEQSAVKGHSNYSPLTHSALTRGSDCIDWRCVSSLATIRKTTDSGLTGLRLLFVVLDSSGLMG